MALEAAQGLDMGTGAICINQPTVMPPAKARKEAPRESAAGEVQGQGSGKAGQGASP